MRIAFVGLGLMGGRMARNLVRKGHELAVANRTRAKAEELAREGARVAGTPAEAAKGADVLFTMLADPEAVSRAALGDGGFLGALRQDALWVDCSTVNPSFSRQMAAEARVRGVRFIDAPVSGTIGPAERGELTFFVGGDKRDLEECRPLLDAMGKSIRYMGAVGMGTSMKLVNNLMIGTAMAAFAEGLSLGEAMGIPVPALLDALLGAPTTAPFLSGKRGKIEKSSWEPEFPLRLMEKDLHLVSVTAWEKGVPQPVTSAAKELYAMARARGLGDSDFSAVIELLRRRGP